MVTLDKLAELVGGVVDGDASCEIVGVSDLEHADEGEISFVVSVKHRPGLDTSRAAAVICPRSMSGIGRPAILVDDPYLAVATIHNHFLARPFRAEGVHPSAIVGSNCTIHQDVTIAAFVSIGDNVRIEAGVTLQPGVVVEHGAVVGEGSEIKSNCTIGYGCTIGKRVVLHPGVVIGSDGFGYATTSLGQHVKRPQVGTVIIEDDVEIGANTCVDRATFGATLIKQGAKIDNLVQVGHNVVVGENTILVAQVGIAGSSTLGRNVVMGGQSALNGHTHLADQVMVAGKSGVHNDLPAKAVVAGYPAVAHKLWLRTSAIIAKLPELVKDVRSLKKDVARLQGKTTE